MGPRHGRAFATLWATAPGSPWDAGRGGAADEPRTLSELTQDFQVGWGPARVRGEQGWRLYNVGLRERCPHGGAESPGDCGTPHPPHSVPQSRAGGLSCPPPSPLSSTGPGTWQALSSDPWKQCPTAGGDEGEGRRALCFPSSSARVPRTPVPGPAPNLADHSSSLLGCAGLTFQPGFKGSTRPCSGSVREF